MTPAATHDPGRLMRLATYASVGVALLLIAVKFVAWTLTGSVSLLSTLIDSLLDAMASIVNLVAVRHALVPADREHRFGHGKAEPLAALGQSAFVAGSAAFLVVEAGRRLIAPQPVQETTVGIVVMVFSIVATLALVRFQRSVVARTNSVAIKADSLHYLGDLLVNGAVIVALVLVRFTEFYWIDSLFALGIAAYILRTAWLIARESLDMLMDRELPDEERKRIVDLVMAEPGITGLHDLRTRTAGPDTFIQLHIEMNGALTLRRAHDIADRVEKNLADAFPNAEVIVHQDPKEVVEAGQDEVPADRVST